MSIEKSTNPAPRGIVEGLSDDYDLLPAGHGSEFGPDNPQIEIVDDLQDDSYSGDPAEGDLVKAALALGDEMGAEGGVEVLGEDGEPVDEDELPPGAAELLASLPHEANIADVLDEIDPSILTGAAQDILDLVQQNITARDGWSTAYRKAIELLGIKNEERSRPWQGACGVTHPLLMESLFRFQSETSVETFRPGGPCKPSILGEETPEKSAAAHRVARDMNMYLTEKMPEYRSEHERMLWTLGLSGQAFKKVYHDPVLERPRSTFVAPEDMVIPWYTDNVHEPEWAAHIIRKSEREVEKLKKNGFYRDVDVQENQGNQYNDSIRRIKADVIGVAEAEFSVNTDDDGLVWLIEMHREFEFEGDDEPKPYIVTIDLNGWAVLSVYRNWAEEDTKLQPLQYFASYSLIPGFGAYGFGYAHLLGGTSDAATKIIRQLVDAGTLANLPGGFKTRGLRIKSGDTPIAPGEFKDVDVVSGKIQENIMALPIKEPSATLFQLYGTLVGEGRTLAAMDNVDLKGMTGETPVGTIIAVLDKMFKPMTAIQSRVHHAMRSELRLLKRIIREYATDSYGYDNGPATRQDYDIIDIVPVSDPNASSVAVRMMQAQYTLQLMAQNPDLYDKAAAHRMALNVAGVPQVDKMLPDKTKVPPLDPAAETMAVLMGQPVRAVLEQDHESHIRVHMNTLQDPMIRATVGQSPNANQMMASLMSHIQEHVAYKYRRDVEMMIGQPLPPPGAPMDPTMEATVAKAIADASDKVLQRNQGIAAQQAQQAQQNDPVMELQEREMEIREREVAFREQKHKDDMLMEQQKLRVQAGGKLADIGSKERMKGAELGMRAANERHKVVVQSRNDRLKNSGKTSDKKD